MPDDDGPSQADHDESERQVARVGSTLGLMIAAFVLVAGIAVLLVWAI